LHPGRPDYCGGYRYRAWQAYGRGKPAYRKPRQYSTNLSTSSSRAARAARADGDPELGRRDLQGPPGHPSSTRGAEERFPMADASSAKRRLSGPSLPWARRRGRGQGLLKSRGRPRLCRSPLVFFSPRPSPPSPPSPLSPSTPPRSRHPAAPSSSGLSVSTAPRAPKATIGQATPLQYDSRRPSPRSLRNLDPRHY